MGKKKSYTPQTILGTEFTIRVDFMKILRINHFIWDVSLIMVFSAEKPVLISNWFPPMLLGDISFVPGWNPLSYSTTEFFSCISQHLLEQWNFSSIRSLLVSAVVCNSLCAIQYGVSSNVLSMSDICCIPLALSSRLVFKEIQWYSRNSLRTIVMVLVSTPMVIYSYIMPFSPLLSCSHSDLASPVVIPWYSSARASIQLHLTIHPKPHLWTCPIPKLTWLTLLALQHQELTKESVSPGPAVVSFERKI